FIDIVGYSKLLINEQTGLLEHLKGMVRGSEQVRAADAAGKLIRLATGDGMALVFRNSPEAPAQCALELARADKEHPELKLRMGIHSGPINEVTDVNERANVTGAGINMAQRVMDCGDAGHILLSQRVADDLEQYPRWRLLLHELGECEVKHGARLRLVNLYTDELGNPALPEKFNAALSAKTEPPAKSKFVRLAIFLILLIFIGIPLLIFTPAILKSWRGTPAPAATPLSVAAAIPEKSIAVLPFESLSEEKANAFFADGVQDEILTNLARIADLKVISRTSVMQYKSGARRNLREIGRQLEVAHLVEGSVQRAGEKVRVNAQLIDARTDAHLWGQTYDRKLADVFAIQSEIATAIADQLQAKLSPEEKAAIEKSPTTDLAAFDLYTRAKTLLLSVSLIVNYQQTLQEAIALLNQAVARDPAFFEAYYQLISAHGIAYATTGDRTPARLALAEAALQAATRLRPDAGETHLAGANYLYYFRRDYNGALAELEGARRSLPNDPRRFELTGYILRRRGQDEEGLRNLERAVELDPRNPFTLQQLAISYGSLRRYPEEAAALDRAITIVPNNVATQTSRALVDYNWKAETRPLHETIDSILAGSPAAISDAAGLWFLCALAEHDPTAAERALVALGENPLWGDGTVIFTRSFGEGLLARMTKDEARAQSTFGKARLEQEKIVQAQPDYAPPLCVLGLINAALGKKEEALRDGRRAIELSPLEKDPTQGGTMLVYFAMIAAWVGERDTALHYLTAGAESPGVSFITTYGSLKLLPVWDPLRGDPRFEKIVASLAPQETRP
ncbi:MAG: adenylate/guanylate cyclase domain-containing protein, partial [Chthoniobacterales bacterium]